MNLFPEFAALQDKVKYVVQHGENEQSSSCPYCGGDIHLDGSYPDRFRMWRKSKTGKALGWCRKCNRIYVPSNPISLEQYKQWIEEREQNEILSIQEANKSLLWIRNEKLWLKYHQNLIGEIRQFYYDRGIKDEWIDYWKLGYCKDKMAWSRGKAFISDSLTIPIFDPNHDLINIKHRLINPLYPNDKYRSEPSHISPFPFYCNLDHSQGTLFLLEGEFKAMTTFICLDDPNMQIIGLPSCTPDLAIVQSLKDYEPIYLCLDPDAYIINHNYSPYLRLVNALDKSRVRNIELPYKIDDMINQGILGQHELKILMRDARKP